MPAPGPPAIPDATPDSAARRITCGIVAHDRLFSDLLANWLSIRAGLSVIVRSGLQGDLGTALDKHRPQLLLTVVGLSAESHGPLETTRRFCATNPGSRVIAVVFSREAFVAPPWLADKLLGVCHNGDSLETLWTAIEKLVPQSEQAGLDQIRRRLAGTPLSEQESQILQFVADGHTTAAIAEMLGISPHTVRTHRKRILVKLGATGASLVRLAAMLRDSARPAASDADAAGPRHMLLP